MASDIFAKIGDIKGESTDAKHKDEIEVLSFSWGVTKEATITHRKAGKGQQEYLVVKMNDVIITGVVHGGSGEGSSETVSLVFAKVDFEYRPQKIDGTLDAGIHFKFDIKANTSG